MLQLRHNDAHHRAALICRTINAGIADYLARHEMPLSELIGSLGNPA